MNNCKFPAEGIFFTSDTHFSHGSIIKHCNRPFANAQEMNEAMIANWNQAVGPSDIVFHLGDFCLGGVGEWNRILDRLNGRIYLILGNHDIRNIRPSVAARFEQVAMEMRIEVEDKIIYLNHYPFLCFEGGYEPNVWQLFGHVHTRQNSTGIDASRLQYLYPTQLDVGVDNSAFTPLSFAQVSARITTQQLKMEN